jgi:hypothetical protein
MTYVAFRDSCLVEKEGATEEGVIDTLTSVEICHVQSSHNASANILSLVTLSSALIAAGSAVPVIGTPIDTMAT